MIQKLWFTRCVYDQACRMNRTYSLAPELLLSVWLFLTLYFILICAPTGSSYMDEKYLNALMKFHSPHLEPLHFKHSHSTFIIESKLKMARTRKSTQSSTRRSNRDKRRSNWATCNSNSAKICLNGGQCHLYNDIKPLCVCPNGFTGEFCQVKIPLKYIFFIWHFSDLMNYKNIIEWTLRKDKEASKSTSRLYIHLLFGWVTLKSSIQ